MKRLSNKHGEGYVQVCVIVLVLCMILSVVLFFATAVATVFITRDNVLLSLDGYVMKKSVDIYSSVKLGNNYTETLSNIEYIDQLCTQHSLERSDGMLHSYDGNGDLRYKMTMPSMDFVAANELEIRLTYMLYMPIRFNGHIVLYAGIPVTANSSFATKL